MTPGESFPGIGQFIDDLPSIADYAGESNPGSVEMQGARPDGSDGAWRMGEWESFDPEELATLGFRGSARENGQTQSGHGVAGMQTRDEIASTLDAIAGRIRKGELPLEKFRAVHPEVAMAISLAALFRLKP